jgi:hypothetical protein
MKALTSYLLIVLVMMCTAYASDLTMMGGWTENVTAANLVSGAGSDLAPLESVSGNVIVNVANTAGTWHLKARLGAGQWNNNFTIWVKRSSDGSGSGTIAGGAGYVQLTATDAEIFTGLNDRSNISLQFKLTGLTKTTLPNTYNSPIIFTVQ